MANLADLVVSIVAQTKQFDKAIQETKKKTEGVEKGIKKTTATIKNLVAGVAVAALVAKIGQIAEAAIDAASDAEEANAKFNTAFQGIEDKAAETAKALAETYGLARQESEKLLGDTGDLLKGFGATATGSLEFSNEIQKLSVDLASYNNVVGGASRVSRILTKSVLGNKDGLSELGVSLLDVDIKQELVRTGQDKLTGQAGKLAKAQATFTLILQQTGDAQGDYIRTSDGFANKTRAAEAAVKDLQVELGRTLLPTATSVSSIFGELTGKLADYIREINNLREAERALEAGEATRQQELLSLKSKQELIEETIKNQKVSLALKDAELLKAGIVKSQEDKANSLVGKAIAQNKIKLDSLNRQIKTIEVLALEEKKAADDKAKSDAERKISDQDKEQQQKIEEKQLKNNLVLIDNIIKASKAKIEVIDDEIAILKTLEGLTDDQQSKQLQAIKILQSEKEAIQDEELESKKQILKEEADERLKNHNDIIAEAKSEGEELRAINKETTDKELEAAEKLKKKKIQLAEDFLNTVASIASAIVGIANNQAREEIRIKQEALSEEIEINNTALQSAIDTNDKELESELKLSSDKLALRLEELEILTKSEQELLDFKSELKEIDLADSIQKSEQKILDLLATGELEDAEEARKLQRDLDNDVTLRALQDQAKIDEEQRIIDITTAKETAAEADRILKENEAAADKILLDNAAAEEKRVKKETALAVWEIEKERFEANQQLALLEIAINTAIGVSKALAQGGIFGIATGALVFGAGIAQAALVNSTPAPPKPAFARGGTATKATTATVGEEGEVMIGMGAKGAPLLEELATRIAAISGGGGQTIININSLYPPRRQDLDRLAEDMFPSNVKANQRRGI
jgi:hypothetical protein